MKKSILLVLLLLSFGIQSIAQNVYLSVPAGGDWNDEATWDIDFDGIGGDGIPAANDIVIIQGNNAGGGAVLVNANVAVGDVLIQYDNSGVLKKGGLPFLSFTLTINGQFAGFDWHGIQNYASPITNVVGYGAMPKFKLVFTGDAIEPGTSDNPAIVFWSHSAPLKNVNFNPSSSTTNIIIDNLSIEASNLKISNGTLYVNNGVSIALDLASTLVVKSGANLIVNDEGVISGETSTLRVENGANLEIKGGINGDGTNTSKFGTITVNNGGILGIGVLGYLNSTTINLLEGSIFNIANNQTVGWWHSGSSEPDHTPTDETSTTNYTRNGDQTVFATTYGNLVLGSGVKTLSSTGTLVVLGNLNIGGSSTFDTSENSNVIDIAGNVDNDGSWKSIQKVNFNGSVDQTIGGNNMVVFDGGVRISNTSATVTLQSQDIDIDGMFDINENASFNPNGRQVYLGGNFVNDGVLSASGTFEFDGTTIISGGGTNNFKDVLISGNLLAPSQTLSIAGNFTNRGTFSNENGTVNFNGINAQNIIGPNPINFYNITVNSTDNVSGITLTNTSTLYNKFTLSAGKFNAGFDLLTLLSESADANARIGKLTKPANFTGSVIIERYVESPAEGYRYFSIPVENGNLGMWSDDFAVTGNFSDTNTTNPNIVNSVVASVFSYNNETQEWVGADADGATTVSFDLVNTKGYSAWTFMNDDFTIEVNGEIGKGNKSVSTVKGDNLIGNPYPSPIDWSTIYNGDPTNENNTVNVNNTVYIRTNNNVYASYSSGAGSGTGHPDQNWAGEISLGQAFWVIGTAPGSVEMTENSKTDNRIQHIRTSGPYNQLRIELAGNDQFDEAIVYFRADATIGFEDQYDGHKKKNGSKDGTNTGRDHINLSTYNTIGDAPLVFNALPFGINCSASSKLNIDDVPVGIYTLNFSDLETMKFGVEITLIDHFLNESISISNSDSYAFEVTEDATSFGDSRFELLFVAATVHPNPVYSYQNNCDDITVVSIIDSQFGVTYSISSNETIIASGIGNGEELAINMAHSVLSIGSNILDLSLDNIGCSNVILPDYLSIDRIGKEEITNVINGSSCGKGSVLLKVEGASGNSYYRWYETFDAIDPILNQYSDEYLTPEIDVTKFYLVSVVNEVGCESVTRAKVIAEVINTPVPNIQIEGEVISTTAIADTYMWYKNDEVIVGEVSDHIIVSESGVYRVKINTNTCTATSENIRVEILGIEDLNDLGIEIYPNPVFDVLNIKSSINDIIRILIYDTKGIEVIRLEYAVPNIIDMSNVKKGIYIVNIETNNQIINYRIRKK